LYNSTDVIFECLEKIKKFKIIIVDNSADKKLKKKITSKYRVEKYILSKKNLGFAKAANLAFKNASTTYCLLLAPDCIIQEDSVLSLLTILKKYENTALISPTFISDSKQYQKNPEIFPEKEDMERNEFEKKIFKTLKNTIPEGDVCYETVLGAAMLFETELIKKTGLFDENFFIFYEDFDLCKKLRNERLAVIQSHQVQAVHTHGQSNSVRKNLKSKWIIKVSMTESELFYLYKNNKHIKKVKNLKKKIPNYIFKFFLNLLLLKLEKAINHLAIVYGYIKFRLK
jgi:GT2 family glycosyltransferase